MCTKGLYKIKKKYFNLNIFNYIIWSLTMFKINANLGGLKFDYTSKPKHQEPQPIMQPPLTPPPPPAQAAHVLQSAAQNEALKDSFANQDFHLTENIQMIEQDYN